jgi:hypothetical protein
METVLAGLEWDKCLVYLDCIIVVGKSFDDMLENLGGVSLGLRQAGLKLKAKKATSLERGFYTFRIAYHRMLLLLTLRR